jgi:hypothetical protein
MTVENDSSTLASFKRLFHSNLHIKSVLYLKFYLNRKLKESSKFLILRISVLLKNVKRGTNKVDRAKRMHCVRSERAIAITLALRRLYNGKKAHARNLACKLATAYQKGVFVWPYQLYLFPSLH